MKLTIDFRVDLAGKRYTVTALPVGVVFDEEVGRMERHLLAAALERRAITQVNRPTHEPISNTDRARMASW
jgi:hypothetical protein